jgi:prepilin-type N-terminal cleavage/methylation domain-containing protein
MHNNMRKQGFTLIEIMVSVALLSVVVVGCVGAFISITDVSRRARAEQSMMDNVSFAVETMVREIRLGYSYSHGSTGNEYYIKFKNSADKWVEYQLNGNAIERKEDTDLSFSALTSTGLTIDVLKFDIDNTPDKQPRVIVIVKGKITDTKHGEKTFVIQTLATQRNVQ